MINKKNYSIKVVNITNNIDGSANVEFDMSEEAIESLFSIGKEIALKNFANMINEQNENNILIIPTKQECIQLAFTQTFENYLNEHSEKNN